MFLGLVKKLALFAEIVEGRNMNESRFKAVAAEIFDGANQNALERQRTKRDFAEPDGLNLYIQYKLALWSCSH